MFLRHLRKKCWRRDEEGATAVEFAIVAVLFLTISFAIIELGRMFWIWNSMEYAMERAVRYTLVEPDATDAELEEVAVQHMTGMKVDVTGLDFSTARSVVSGIEVVEAHGEYVYTPMLPLLPATWDALTLSATARLPVPENDPTPPEEP
jgi:Flp pilus assembly protein TadG